MSDMAKLLGRPHELVEAHRRRAGWSRDVLAAKAGMSASQLTKLERGERKLTLEWIDRLARALDVPPATFVEARLRGAPAVAEDPAVAAAPATAAIVEVLGERYAAIRRWDGQVSAGAGRSAPGQAVFLRHTLFRLDWVRSVTTTALEQLAALEVDGDSMEPTLRSRDLVLVDMQQREPHRRDAIYVLNRDGDLQIKRVSAHPTSGRLSIRSDNPAYESWPDIDPREVDVVGRVFWIGRRL